MKRDIKAMLMLTAVPALMLTGCGESAEQTESTPSSPTGAKTIGFRVNLDQDWYAQHPATRAALQHATPRNIEMRGSDGRTAWLQSTTVTGIDERKSSVAAETATLSAADEATRGTALSDVSQMSAFSDFCYTADDNQPYFQNLSVGTDGQTQKAWPGEKSLKCFAVHPYDSDGSHFSSTANGGTYSFTVNGDVAKQVDLMYANSGVVAYNDACQVPLHFMHALTAVKFAMGDKPNFGKTISSITLKNVYTTGTLTLPSAQTTTAGTATATWSGLGNQADITLSGLSFEANASSQNQAVTNESQTFLMIPQSLSGVSAEIKFSDGSTVTASLSGDADWEAGTTRN